MDGLIVGNTTVSRPGVESGEAGGLSGAPLRPLATAVVADVYRLTQGPLPSSSFSSSPLKQSRPGDRARPHRGLRRRGQRGGRLREDPGGREPRPALHRPHLPGSVPSAPTRTLRAPQLPPGFPVVGRIKRELADLLIRDGFASVQDAVGADHRK